MLLLAATLALPAALAAAQDALAPPEVAPLVAQASAAAAEAVRTLASLVCEERYVQTVRQQRVVFGNRAAPRPVVDTASRTLLSDYLLVRLPGTRGWVPFRDVYSVDGRPVRDREDRLLSLFVTFRADRLEQAERIRDESSRYNLGSGTYDINVPTFALQFLLPEVRGRFRFRTAGREAIDGVETTVVEYEEVAHPTIIRGARDEDVPASGRAWIATGDGRIAQTRLETRSGGKRTRIDVRYGREPRFGLWVPLEMREHHAIGGETLESRATYANYRRFQVETKELLPEE